MESKDKKTLSETDVCDLFISPAIKNAGWDPLKQIRREVTLTPGPVVVRGNMSSRNKKKKKFADYVLSLEPGIPVAVVEAKDNNHSRRPGMQQALDYAEILDVPFAFSSNGDAFLAHDRTGATARTSRRDFPRRVPPARRALWHATSISRHQGRSRASSSPALLRRRSGKEPRYYQVDAINRTVEAIAHGEKRILLVMATGTGKTYTAFQIIWRLWKSGGAKRILFLADRNILVDQTWTNDFKPFGSVDDQDHEPHGRQVLRNLSRLYQAVTAPNEEDKIYKQFSPDFFDLVVDRRVPPRQRRRRLRLAQDPRILHRRHPDRPDRHAEGDQGRLQHRILRRADLHLLV